MTLNLSLDTCECDHSKILNLVSYECECGEGFYENDDALPC